MTTCVYPIVKCVEHITMLIAFPVSFCDQKGTSSKAFRKYILVPNWLLLNVKQGKRMMDWLFWYSDDSM